MKFYNFPPKTIEKNKMKQEFKKVYEDVSLLEENTELNFEIYTGERKNPENVFI